MAYPFVPASSQGLSALEVHEVHHWPLVRAYAEQLGLVELINGLVPSEMEIDAGTIVLGMVIDTLSRRSPLYHLEAFFEHQDRALLLGREVEAKVFNDDTVARVLDRLFEAGTQAAAEQARGSRTAYHYLEVEVEAPPHYGPGRPKQDAPRPVKRLDYGLRVELCATKRRLPRRASKRVVLCC